MSARVLSLPSTPKGREHLRACVSLARGWEFPDGSNAADYDWDVAAIEADEFADSYLRWSEAQGGGGR